MTNSKRSDTKHITGQIKLSKHQTSPEDIKDMNNSVNEEKDQTNALAKSIVINADIIVSKIKGTPETYYTEVKKLGEGSYGKVVKVRHNTTGLFRAMKTIKRQGKDRSKDSDIINEIEMLKKIDHPNIVKIFEYYIDEKGYYLITEYCDKGELYEKLIAKGHFTEILAGKIMYQLLSAVNYCHLNNIVHRDLKPENILVNNVDKKGHYNIKVIDFGTAKIYEKSKTEQKIIGSSYYIAPEVLKGSYDNKCDLWSCGVILYILLTGKPPFPGNSDTEVLEKVKLGKYSMDIPQMQKVSQEAKDLITKLLQLNTAKRLSAKEALKHSWFKRTNAIKNVEDIDKSEVRLAIDRMKNSNKGNALQRLVVAYLIHNIPQLGGIREANIIFDFFDEDMDGKISMEELAKGYKKIFKTDPKREIDEIFSVVDNDKNGYIEYEEFVRVTMDTEILLAEEILQFAFNYLDKDGSGEISYDELVHVFGIDNDENSKRGLKRILDDIDENGNGEISFEEFKFMMEKILGDINGKRNN